MVIDMNSQSKKEDVRAEFKRLNKRSNLIRLAGLMMPYLGAMLLCGLLVVMINVAELIKPLAAAVIIDDFITAGKEQSGLYSITGLGIAYFLLAVMSAVFSVVQVRKITKISQLILHTMRDKEFC